MNFKFRRFLHKSQQAISLDCRLAVARTSQKFSKFVIFLTTMDAKLSALELNRNESEAVMKWVDGFKLSRCTRKLNRDFSDGVLLAKIVKSELPNLVELHNYNGCCAVQGKIENWDTLNRKVLKKLQIHLTPEEIEKLANSEANYIEEVLSQVMKQINRIKSNKSKTSISQHSSTVKVWKQIGDHLEEVVQQMIPLAIYEELQVKNEHQRQTIAELKETIDDLQSALDSKSQIIDDQQKRLEKKQKSSVSSFRDSIANFF